jgi:hypothetical protein
VTFNKKTSVTEQTILKLAIGYKMKESYIIREKSFKNSSSSSFDPFTFKFHIGPLNDLERKIHITHEIKHFKQILTTPNGWHWLCKLFETYDAILKPGVEKIEKKIGMGEVRIVDDSKREKEIYENILKCEKMTLDLLKIFNFLFPSEGYFDQTSPEAIKIKPEDIGPSKCTVRPSIGALPYKHNKKVVYNDRKFPIFFLNYEVGGLLMRRVPVSFRVLMEHDANAVEFFQCLFSQNKSTNLNSLEEIYCHSLQEYFILLHHYANSKRLSNYGDAVLGLCKITDLCLKLPYKKVNQTDFPGLYNAQLAVKEHSKYLTAGLSKHIENFQAGGLAMAMINNDNILSSNDREQINIDSNSYIESLFKKTSNSLKNEVLKQIFSELHTYSKMNITEIENKIFKDNKKVYELFANTGSALNLLNEKLISISTHSYTRYLGNI